MKEATAGSRKEESGAEEVYHLSGQLSDYYSCTGGALGSCGFLLLLLHLYLPPDQAKGKSFLGSHEESCSYRLDLFEHF